MSIHVLRACVCVCVLAHLNRLFIAIYLFIFFFLATIIFATWLLFLILIGPEADDGSRSENVRVRVKTVEFQKATRTHQSRRIYRAVHDHNKVYWLRRRRGTHTSCTWCIIITIIIWYFFLLASAYALYIITIHVGRQQRTRRVH